MSIKTFVDTVKYWLRPSTVSEIETYIASKNPKNAADVEYLIKQWNYSQERYWFKC